MYIPTGEGWPYLAAVEDLHSRRIVGWSMSERIDGRLVVDALEMAVARRLPGAGLVAHSDRGSRYAGEHYPAAAGGPWDRVQHEPARRTAGTTRRWSGSSRA